MSVGSPAGSLWLATRRVAWAAGAASAKNVTLRTAKRAILSDDRRRRPPNAPVTMAATLTRRPRYVNWTTGWEPSLILDRSLSDWLNLSAYSANRAVARHTIAHAYYEPGSVSLELTSVVA